MSKKWVITLSILFGVVAVILISMWTLFGLSVVSVEYSTTTKNLSVSDSEIVEAGKFRKHACVFFEGKKASIQRIMDYAQENPNFAYIKVLNIETVFPNKFVIHVAEREELFAVEYNSKFLITDRDLRVLRVEETYDSTTENAILLSGLNVKNEAISIGDFLNVEQSSITNLYSALVKNNRSYVEQIGRFRSIEASKYQDEKTNKSYTQIKIETFAGRKLVIKNIDFALDEKVQKLFAVEAQLFSMQTNTEGKIVDADGNVVYVVKLPSKQYVKFDAEQHEESEKIALTYELLSTCYIEVDNLTLTDYVKRTKNDIYYAIVEE